MIKRKRRKKNQEKEKEKKEKYVCEVWKKKMALDKVGTFLNNKTSSNQ
jgi:hypothetical protein